jgi:outer membrane protein assembly factor BamD
MKIKISFISLVVAAALLAMPAPVQAFWMWTPETGKWVNPKHNVKPSPEEQLSFADEFFKMCKYEDALREYKKLLKNYPKAREAAMAQFQIGRVWEEQKKFWRAIEEYQKAVDRYPFSELGPKVVERQYVIANLFLEGKAADHEFAKSLLGSDYQVPEVFQKVIKNDPYGAYAPAAQYKIGLFYLEKQSYQEARDAFEKTVNDYPDSKWAESARYQIAVADAKRSVGPQYDQRTTAIAVEGFEDYVKANPDSQLSSAARSEIGKLRLKEAENNYVIGDYYFKNKKYVAARTYWQSLVDQYADTRWAAKAEEKLRQIPADVK